jgi:hypothetical protein
MLRRPTAPRRLRGRRPSGISPAMRWLSLVGIIRTSRRRRWTTLARTALARREPLRTCPR